jgi:hypothetical protein
VRGHFEQYGADLIAISIVPCSGIVEPGELHKFSLHDFERRIRYALDKANIKVALGGIDFSYNEDKNGNFEPFWSVHLYLITFTTDRECLRRKLKKLFPKEDRIPRPMKITDFKNLRRRRSYVLKTQFRRRITCNVTKTHDGHVRTCRNTTYDKLRAKERGELFTCLARWGLADRLIFRGAKPVTKGNRVQISAA